MNLKHFLQASLLIAMMPFVSCGDDEDENESDNTPGNEQNNPGKDNNNNSSLNDTDSHEYVDLGLPSGTLWATYNIGATKPEEFGDYFAWGETEAKNLYDWDTYKLASVELNEDWKEEIDDYFDRWTVSFSKYNLIDNLSTLDQTDDVATAKWGNEWRMPTIEELNELISICKHSRTVVNGVVCDKFTASNGNSIFLPSAGDYFLSEPYAVNESGCYWSSSLDIQNNHYAQYLFLFEDEQGCGEYGRCDGFPVRAVRAKK